MTTELPHSSPQIKNPPAVRKLHFLDSLLEMGEEPYEISYEVKETAETCALEYSAWLVSRGLEFPVEGLKLLLVGLFEFTYIDYWSPRAALRKLSRAKIAEFYLLFGKVDLEQHSAPLSVAELLTLFFHFLAESGYEVPAKRFADEISKQQRTIRKSGGA
jgi:hypothetical protein